MRAFFNGTVMHSIFQGEACTMLSGTKFDESLVANLRLERSATRREKNEFSDKWLNVNCLIERSIDPFGRVGSIRRYVHVLMK